MILRIKGIKKARAKGRVYYYHRKTMTRLPGDPGSTEFIAKLRELEVPKPSGPRSGTLGALIAAYKQAAQVQRKPRLDGRQDPPTERFSDD